MRKCFWVETMIAGFWEKNFIYRNHWLKTLISQRLGPAEFWGAQQKWESFNRNIDYKSKMSIAFVTERIQPFVLVL